MSRTHGQYKARKKIRKAAPPRRKATSTHYSWSPESPSTPRRCLDSGRSPEDPHYSKKTRELLGRIFGKHKVKTLYAPDALVGVVDDDVVVLEGMSGARLREAKRAVCAVIGPALPSPRG